MLFLGVGVVVRAASAEPWWVRTRRSAASWAMLFELQQAGTTYSFNARRWSLHALLRTCTWVNVSGLRPPCEPLRVAGDGLLGLPVWPSGLAHVGGGPPSRCERVRVSASG